MTGSGRTSSLSQFTPKVLGYKGRLPRKGSNQVRFKISKTKTCFGWILKLPHFRDSTLTLASVAGLELNGNSEAAVAWELTLEPGTLMIWLLNFKRLTVGFQNKILSYSPFHPLAFVLICLSYFCRSQAGRNPWNPWILEIHAESPTSALRVHDNLQA